MSKQKASFQLLNTNFEWLTKLLASSGLMSRRRAEYAINSGEVTVNGNIVQKNQILQRNAYITWKNIPVQLNHQTHLWAINKSKGSICTFQDKPGIETLRNKLYTFNKDETCIDKNIFHLNILNPLPVRAEGLVLLSNNGKLMNFFQSKNESFKSIYHIKLQGKLVPGFIDKISKKVLSCDSYLPKLKIIRKGHNISWIEAEYLDYGVKHLYNAFNNESFKILRFIRFSCGPYKLSSLYKFPIIPIDLHKSIKNSISQNSKKTSLVIQNFDNKISEISSTSINNFPDENFNDSSLSELKKLDSNDENVNNKSNTQLLQPINCSISSFFIKSF